MARRLSRDAGPVEILATASALLARGVDACMATVIGAEGSSPSTPGQKLVLGADGTMLGTVGGGGVEREAVDRMKVLLEEGSSTPISQWYALAKDLSMACGGRVHLLFEPMSSATPILLVGAGHIGSALASMLPRLGFRVIVTDERPSAVDQERAAAWPNVDARLGAPSEVASEVPIKAPVVVATHDHVLDEAALVWAVDRGHHYVGGVGSKSKAAKLRKTLQGRGVAEERIEQVRMPIGLKLGGRTPEEIALSIAAELVAWRAGKLETFTG
jgi:xanthine dehydrogenase accessory factor